MKEPSITTSISLEHSKLENLRKIAYERGYSSRNNLISFILNDWLEKQNRKCKKEFS